MDTFHWSRKDCSAVDSLLKAISGKHSLHLLAILALYGEKSFGDLKREMTPISPKVLAECLEKLVENGFVLNRKSKGGNVNRSFYAIAERDLFLPILFGLRRYAGRPS